MGESGSERTRSTPLGRVEHPLDDNLAVAASEHAGGRQVDLLKHEWRCQRSRRHTTQVADMIPISIGLRRVPRVRAVVERIRDTVTVPVGYWGRRSCRCACSRGRGRCKRCWRNGHTQDACGIRLCPRGARVTGELPRQRLHLPCGTHRALGVCRSRTGHGLVAACRADRTHRTGLGVRCPAAAARSPGLVGPWATRIGGAAVATPRAGLGVASSRAAARAAALIGSCTTRIGGAAVATPRASLGVGSSRAAARGAAPILTCGACIRSAAEAAPRAGLRVGRPSAAAREAALILTCGARIRSAAEAAPRAGLRVGYPGAVARGATLILACWTRIGGTAEATRRACSTIVEFPGCTHCVRNNRNQEQAKSDASQRCKEPAGARLLAWMVTSITCNTGTVCGEITQHQGTPCRVSPNGQEMSILLPLPGLWASRGAHYKAGAGVFAPYRATRPPPQLVATSLPRLILGPGMNLSDLRDLVLAWLAVNPARVIDCPPHA